MAQPLPGRVVRRTPVDVVEEALDNLERQNRLLAPQIRAQQSAEYDKLTRDQKQDLGISGRDDFIQNHIRNYSPQLKNLIRQRREIAIEHERKREELKHLDQQGWQRGLGRKRKTRKSKKSRKTRRNR
jgi:hypothetical protein